MQLPQCYDNDDGCSGVLVHSGTHGAQPGRGLLVGGMPGMHYMPQPPGWSSPGTYEMCIYTCRGTRWTFRGTGRTAWSASRSPPSISYKGCGNDRKGV